LKEAGKTLLSRAAFADSPLLMAETLNSRGMVLVQQEMLAKAQLFEQAIEKRNAAGVPDGLGDAQTLNNIGEVSLMKHKYIAAEDAFLRSLEIKTL